MNSGSLNKQQMAGKLGSQWKPFWKTCTSRVTRLQFVLQPTIGAGTTTYPSHPLPLRPHFLRFSHILNIPTYGSHNHMMPSQINYTFSNLAGDALLNTIHRVPLFLYLGHRGDLHHHPHHQPHFTGPCTRTTLLHPDINLTNQYRLTNRDLWICRTPVFNVPFRFATVKKTDYMGMYWLFNVVQLLLPLLSSGPSLLADNFITLQLWLNLLSDAMAPSSRPHPYRATPTVNTPQGPRTSAWLAGHGGLPGDWDPPPPRPVLVLVDYSPLQELTHRSQPDHALYSVLASSNFRNVSAGELEALFTWARLFEPVEAGIFPLRDLRTALTTRLRTQWDIHMVPSDLELRYGDLEGDVFPVPLDWTIMQLLEEYRPEWRIRQYNYIESTFLVPGSSQPFVLRLCCHKVRQGIILP